MSPVWLHVRGAETTLSLHIQPAARKTEVAGAHGDALKIRLAAPPVDGKANAHLREFLATLFGVAKSRVTLLAGESGRDKRLRIAAPRRLPPGIEPPTASR